MEEISEEEALMLVMLRERREFQEPLIVKMIDDALKSPKFDWNYRYKNIRGPWSHYYHQRSGFLHIAICMLMDDICIKLISIPQMDLNARDQQGNTPLLLAIEHGNLESTQRALLMDHRTDINAVGGQSRPGSPITALSHVVMFENHETQIKLILSGLKKIQDIDTAKKECAESRPIGPHILPKYAPKGKYMPLLEAFQNNRFQAQKEWRAELGLEDYGPVSLYVPLVLLCDGYFTLVDDTNPDINHYVKRFFTIASMLPEELRMILCNRVFDVNKNTIRIPLFNMALKIYIRDGYVPE